MNQKNPPKRKKNKTCKIKINYLGFSFFKSKFLKCFKTKKIKDKYYYIEKWRKYLNSEVNTSKEMNDPFNLLTFLWGHKNVIKELEKIRLNPNLLNKNKIRNDLEFYIPQLCSFLIFGDYEIVQEFFSFLCKCCFASYNFAHRIIWFLKSSLNNNNNNNKTNEKINNYIKIIQTIFKSNFDQNLIENFYINGSNDYINYLKNENLIFDYFNNKIDNINSNKIFIENKIKKREYLNNLNEFYYINQLKKENLLENKKENKNISLKFLKPSEINLNLFKIFNFVTNDENNINFQYIKSIDNNDINLCSFLSNINFYDHLCNICDILLNSNFNERKKILLNEINKINKILPCNVYVPFYNKNIRNFIICGISISECHIFKTKNRAPFQITMECVRLDEINYLLKNESILTLNESEKKEKKSFFKEIEKITKKNKKNNNENNIVIINNNNVINEKKKIKFKYFKNKDIFLYENDIKNSKPILVENLFKKNVLNNNLNENDSLFFNNKISKPSKSARNKMNKYNTISNESNLTNNSFIQKNNSIFNNKSKEIEKIIKNNFNNIKSDNKYNSSNNILKFNLLNSKNSNNNYNLNSNSNSNSNSISEEDYSQNNKINNKDTSNNKLKQIEINNIENNNNNNIDYFGEFIEQQTLRLKSLSPFGFLSSYQLFNVIIKSGEDLRQEQFACQLINEFYQIFKFEKVHCWVYPYEIIATGKDVGIVEVIPNSTSIDEIKKLSKKNISLKEFYDTYFNINDNNKYKTAIKNFIYSLAGYSLVCYFLQIKDRHNANILIDNKGHLIHIDFGFMLSNAPGKGLKFENAPFKLTNDFVEVLGGTDTKYFNDFRKSLWKGFLACINHYEKIITLVEMMFCGHGNNMSYFEGGNALIDQLKLRFVPRPGMKKRDYIEYCDKLIEQSLDNWRTKWYDKFQYHFQGIMA